MIDQLIAQPIIGVMDMILYLLLIPLLSVISPVEGSVMTTIITIQAKASLPVEDKTSQAIKGLASRSSGTRSRAQKKLLEIAKESTSSRGLVIRKLIEILEKPGTEYDTWYVAADLLGELKSTEALETLIKNLDRNNGNIGLSSSHYPALRAVVKIGQPAVSKLTTALFTSSPSVRGMAAWALGMIGGNEAKDALERALKTEKDEEVIGSIRAALSNNQWK